MQETPTTPSESDRGWRKSSKRQGLPRHQLTAHFPGKNRQCVRGTTRTLRKGQPRCTSWLRPCEEANPARLGPLAWSAPTSPGRCRTHLKVQEESHDAAILFSKEGWNVRRGGGVPDCCAVDTFSTGRLMSAKPATTSPHLNVGAQKWTAAGRLRAVRGNACARPSLWANVHRV